LVWRIVALLRHAIPFRRLKQQAMKNQKNAEPELYALFIDNVRDLYWAENHLVKALPKMIASASSKELKDVLTNHLTETKTHVGRIEKIFKLLDTKAIAKKCDAMEGLTKEGEVVIETTPAGTLARDTGIILASKKVEHYEITSYTGVHQLASILGFKDVGAILRETLAEETNADKLLSKIAEDKLGKIAKKA